MSYEKPVCPDFETGLYHSISDNVVCLWKLGEGGGAGNIAMDTPPNQENWTVTKMLRYQPNKPDSLHFNDPLITGVTSKISTTHVGQLTPAS